MFRCFLPFGIQGRCRGNSPKRNIRRFFKSAINAANKAFLNARARVNVSEQYTEEAKTMKKELMAKKKGGQTQD